MTRGVNGKTIPFLDLIGLCASFVVPSSRSPSVSPAACFLDTIRNGDGEKNNIESRETKKGTKTNPIPALVSGNEIYKTRRSKVLKQESITSRKCESSEKDHHKKNKRATDISYHFRSTYR
ncbi:potassium voltage gated channel protein Shaw [Striga asiatica]|uniref:Potassium voltage gated channel protein Shaw n=1 Tax=Striga asiatica TaxID=4170 RepID=A0A5A7PTJ9_STRAF|nr:potassium voltage gated channel protein Shaw [Striga asiatica]